MTESQFSLEVIKLLGKNNIYYFGVPNPGKRSFWEQQEFIRLGGRAGVSDLVLLLPDKQVVFLELKVGKGKQSDAQIIFQQKVESLGFCYIIARTITEIENLIKETK